MIKFCHAGEPGEAGVLSRIRQGYKGGNSKFLPMAPVTIRSDAKLAPKVDWSTIQVSAGDSVESASDAAKHALEVGLCGMPDSRLIVPPRTVLDY